jgi:hypothetical protein
MLELDEGSVPRLLELGEGSVPRLLELGTVSPPTSSSLLPELEQDEMNTTASVMLAKNIRKRFVFIINLPL